MFKRRSADSRCRRFSRAARSGRGLTRLPLAAGKGEEQPVPLNPSPAGRGWAVPLGSRPRPPPFARSVLPGSLPPPAAGWFRGARELGGGGGPSR